MLQHVLLLRLLLPFGLLLLFHVRVLAAERLLYVRTSIIRQRHLQVGPGRLSNAKLSWSVLLYCAFCGSICMLCQGFLLFSNLSLYSPHIYIYIFKCIPWQYCCNYGLDLPTSSAPTWHARNPRWVSDRRGEVSLSNCSVQRVSGINSYPPK